MVLDLVLYSVLISVLNAVLNRSSADLDNQSSIRVQWSNARCRRQGDL